MHSVYWQSAHWSDEHCYFLELQPTAGSKLLATLTAADVDPVVDKAFEIPPKLVLERPGWFAPEARSDYELWASPDAFRTFGILRDKKDGRLFVYGQNL